MCRQPSLGCPPFVLLSFVWLHGSSSLPASIISRFSIQLVVVASTFFRIFKFGMREEREQI